MHCTALRCCAPLFPIRLCVAQRSHLRSLSRLCEVHAAHVSGLESEFARAASSLRAHFDSAQASLRAAHSAALSELRLLVSAVEAEEAERVNEAKQAHETEREEVRNKNLEAINELRITLENRIEELERAFDDHHRYYRDMTDASAEHFRQLKADDALLSLSIFEKRRRLSKLSALLQHWRAKLASLEKDGREKNAALRQHKAHMQRQCDALKGRMAAFRSAQQRRLTTLTGQAQAAIQCSQDAVQHASTLLQLAAMARSRETESEKVRADAAHSAAQAQPRPQSGERPLQRFLASYNKVVLDVLSMEAEKARLADDNRALRRQLKQYLDGLAVTADTVGPVNPLLIVNGRWRSQQPPLSHTTGEATLVSTLRPRLAQTVTQQLVVQAVQAHAGGRR